MCLHLASTSHVCVTYCLLILHCSDFGTLKAENILENNQLVSSELGVRINIDHGRKFGRHFLVATVMHLEFITNGLS